MTAGRWAVPGLREQHRPALNLKVLYPDTGPEIIQNEQQLAEPDVAINHSYWFRIFAQD